MHFKGLNLNGVKGLVIAGFLAYGAQANALVMGSLSEADSSFGVNSITLDSVTNLEWLDLDFTTTYSFNSASAQFGASGVFEGFSIATASQVSELISHAGINIPLTGSAAQTAFDDFHTLVGGQVDDFGSIGCVLSLNGIVNNAGALGIAGVGLDRKPLDSSACGTVRAGSEFITFGPVPFGLFVSPDTTISAHNGSSQITLGGIFLVKEATVDEPSILGVFAIGLGLMSVLRSKKAVSLKLKSPSF